MKSILFYSFLFFSFILLSFATVESDKKNSLNFRDIEKSVVQIKGNLFAGKYEVSNVLYRIFLDDLIRKNNPDLIKAALIDSLNWRDKLAYNEPYVELYFRHPAYNNYPVVNVTYEGANLFCEWLTNAYNAFSKRKYKKVIFRLPVEGEWETAAKGGIESNEYAWGNRLYLNNHYMCNFKQMGDESIKYDSIKKQFIVEYTGNHGLAGSINDNADITAPVDAYCPNPFGIYNICGNVAEMVKEKGISRGGSWKDVGGDVKTASKKKYSNSATDLGFRYFMEVVEK